MRNAAAMSWYAHDYTMEDCVTGVRSKQPHVVPKDDLKEHVHPFEDVYVDTCPCSPVIDEDGIIVHKSFDGREAFENGTRKVS